MARNNLIDNAFRSAQRLLDPSFEPVTTITKQDASKLAYDMKLDQGVTNLDGTPFNTQMNQGYEADTFGQSLDNQSLEEEILPIKKRGYIPIVPDSANPALSLIRKAMERGVPDAGAAEGSLGLDSEASNFVTNWGKYYQTDDSLIKNTQARFRLAQNYTVPNEALESIDIAASIFDTDKGYSAVDITEFLSKIGQIESKYETKVQKDGGVARSYWQVEPKTARDLMTNSRAWFGEKFEETFKDASWNKGNAKDSLKDLSLKQWSNLLLEDSDLAATLAAGKIITTFPKKD